MADDKKLTEKELKRKSDFEKFNSEMQQKGYKIKNIIINTQQAKPLCLLIMLPFIALAFWIYYNVNGFDLDCASVKWVLPFIVSPFTVDIFDILLFSPFFLKYNIKYNIYLLIRIERTFDYSITRDTPISNTLNRTIIHRENVNRSHYIFILNFSK